MRGRAAYRAFRHHQRCPGSERCTRGRGPPAEVARALGWAAGTIVEGDEGFGMQRIRITALGERAMLAICVDHGDGVGSDHEGLWVLDQRCWVEAALSDQDQSSGERNAD